MLLCIAAFLFNRSDNAAFENETYRVHSFNTTPNGVIDSTKNSFPVRVISMMSPLFMSSTGFILFQCTKSFVVIVWSISEKFIPPNPPVYFSGGRLACGWVVTPLRYLFRCTFGYLHRFSHNKGCFYCRDICEKSILLIINQELRF